MIFNEFNENGNSFEALNTLTSAYFVEDWIYINSYLLGEEKGYGKAVLTSKEIENLIELVINEMLKEKSTKILLKKAIEEIDFAISNTIENDITYQNLFIWQLHISNLPYSKWQDYKKFLIHLRQKFLTALDI